MAPSVTIDISLPQLYKYKLLFHCFYYCMEESYLENKISLHWIKDYLEFLNTILIVTEYYGQGM
jgi:hypothetical protein